MFTDMLMYALYINLLPTEARKDVRFPGIEVTNGCQPPCECWEPNCKSIKYSELLSYLSSPN